MSGTWPVKEWIDAETPVRIGWATGMGGMVVTLTGTSQTGLTFDADGETWFAPWTSVLHLRTTESKGKGTADELSEA